MKNRLISIEDLTKADAELIFKTAADMKKNPKAFQSALSGKMFGLIFEKPSTRTWVSFETGIFSMGGGVIYLGPEDIKLGVREEVRDIGRVLERYLSGVILRTFKHETITEISQYFKGTVVNGLSDFEHPCQVLADLFTLREQFGGKKKPVLAFVGDGNNILHSLMLLTALTGGVLRYATPEIYQPALEVVKKAKTIASKTGALIEGSFDAKQAVKGSDAIYTDVWVSMGEEKIRAKKLKAFQEFQVNEKLMRLANPGAVFMHCLPAHRGEEVTESVMEGKQSIVFDQAENRLHVQKAVLYLMNKLP